MTVLFLTFSTLVSSSKLNYKEAILYLSLSEIKQPLRHQLNPLAALNKIVQKIRLHNAKVEKNRQMARVMIQC